MGSQERETRTTERPGRIQVEDAAGRRPFMRGIMIHSLMARGVSFEDAFRAANALRDRLRGRAVVQKEELAKAVREMLGDAALAAEQSPAFTPDIHVTGAGGVAPFSKGHLSQSLLAAALDPNDAFDVAREIERDLVARGMREVDRQDLRRLTCEMLESRVGPQAAERYMVWRRYQDPDRPVVLLIGGTAGVGKTSLALEVAHRLGIGRVASSDSIRQIMRIMLSPELVPAIHASSYDAHQLLPESALGDEPVIEGFQAQASIVSVGIRASMDRAVSENASLVIDGVAVAPGMIDLDHYSETAHVISLVVATLDEETLRERFRSRARGQHQRTAARYLENLDAILRIQDHYLELADRHDVPIVDNVSFDRSVQLIIRHVTETLGGRRAVDASAAS